MGRIRLDLSVPEFQDSWFALERTEFDRVAASLAKIRRLSWSEFYRSPGFKWEAIKSHANSDGSRLYSFRITQSCRAIAAREGEALRLFRICAHHDAAYS